MTIDASYIDQIVRNVMQEMKTRMPQADHAPAKPAAESVVSPALPILSRVVSEDVLIAARAAGQTIALQPGAIITPSGRDFIRKNSVRLSSNLGTKAASSGSGLFIVVGTNPTVLAAATTAGWRTSSATAEAEAAKIAQSQLSTSLVTCCGGEPSVIACLLNRNPSVRAAVISKATNLLTLTAVMSPQVVCLDSSGWSFGEILKLLRSLSSQTALPNTWSELSTGGIR